MAKQNASEKLSKEVEASHRASIKKRQIERHNQMVESNQRKARLLEEARVLSEVSLFLVKNCTDRPNQIKFFIYEINKKLGVSTVRDIYGYICKCLEAKEPHKDIAKKVSDAVHIKAQKLYFGDKVTLEEPSIFKNQSANINDLLTECLSKK